MNSTVMHSVLVVDDDISLRPMLAAWVNRFGFTAYEAASAEAALQHLEHTPADIALCYVNMPGRDGVWLAGRIREQHPTTAVIMATSVDDADVAVSTLSNDVVDYLLKPFDSTRLREALALGLDWHRASVGDEDLHHVLQSRLRTRRAAVAATLAQAQASAQQAADSLIAMLQLHEKDGRGHSTRVTQLAIALADELGLPDDKLEDLEFGAMLHDVGKIDMPTEILCKPAPLDDAEWDVMRTHPQVGYDLVRKLPHLAGAAEIVLAHHEAFDGSGYPHGLKGRNIPFAARILTIADSYDSMTHPHTQRPAMPAAMAMREIERCSGSQFDPDAAAALGRVLQHASEPLTA
ncbi:MAG TPA: HD domain-containing phosphohydrolase [Vicinamibacterales bacterium]|nr:HD domain-containing phosphohydrolase [Vicinamibacterales bacterium]